MQLRQTLMSSVVSLEGTVIKAQETEAERNPPPVSQPFAEEETDSIREFTDEETRRALPVRQALLDELSDADGASFAMHDYMESDSSDWEEDKFETATKVVEPVAPPSPSAPATPAGQNSRSRRARSSFEDADYEPPASASRSLRKRVNGRAQIADPSASKAKVAPDIEGEAEAEGGSVSPSISRKSAAPPQVIATGSESDDVIKDTEHSGLDVPSISAALAGQRSEEEPLEGHDEERLSLDPRSPSPEPEVEPDHAVLPISSPVQDMPPSEQKFLADEARSPSQAFGGVGESHAPALVGSQSTTQPAQPKSSLGFLLDRLASDDDSVDSDDGAYTTDGDVSDPEKSPKHKPVSLPSSQRFHLARQGSLSPSEPDSEDDDDYALQSAPTVATVPTTKANGYTIIAPPIAQPGPPRGSSPDPTDADKASPDIAEELKVADPGVSSNLRELSADRSVGKVTPAIDVVGAESERLEPGGLFERITTFDTRSSPEQHSVLADLQARETSAPPVEPARSSDPIPSEVAIASFVDGSESVLGRAVLQVLEVDDAVQADEGLPGGGGAQALREVEDSKKELGMADQTPIERIEQHTPPGVMEVSQDLAEGPAARAETTSQEVPGSPAESRSAMPQSGVIDADGTEDYRQAGRLSEEQEASSSQLHSLSATSQTADRQGLGIESKAESEIVKATDEAGSMEAESQYAITSDSSQARKRPTLSELSMAESPVKERFSWPDSPMPVIDALATSESAETVQNGPEVGEANQPGNTIEVAGGNAQQEGHAQQAPVMVASRSNDSNYSSSSSAMSQELLDTIKEYVEESMRLSPAKATQALPEEAAYTAPASSDREVGETAVNMPVDVAALPVTIGVSQQISEPTEGETEPEAGAKPITEHSDIPPEEALIVEGPTASTEVGQTDMETPENAVPAPEVVVKSPSPRKQTQDQLVEMPLVSSKVVPDTPRRSARIATRSPSPVPILAKHQPPQKLYPSLEGLSAGLASVGSPAEEPEIQSAIPESADGAAGAEMETGERVNSEGSLHHTRFSDLDPSPPPVLTGFDTQSQIDQLTSQPTPASPLPYVTRKLRSESASSQSSLEASSLPLLENSQVSQLREEASMSALPSPVGSGNVSGKMLRNFCCVS